MKSPLKLQRGDRSSFCWNEIMVGWLGAARDVGRCPSGNPERELWPQEALLCYSGPWGGRLSLSLPPQPDGAASYQLTGAHVTDDVHVHLEAIGEGGLQMDVALPVRFWQLAHVSPVQVLDSPQLHLVCALQGPHCQARQAWTDHQGAVVPEVSRPSSSRDVSGPRHPAPCPSSGLRTCSLQAQPR